MYGGSGTCPSRAATSSGVLGVGRGKAGPFPNTQHPTPNTQLHLPRAVFPARDDGGGEFVLAEDEARSDADAAAGLDERLPAGGRQAAQQQQFYGAAGFLP